jgi:hypothetical protein
MKTTNTFMAIVVAAAVVGVSGCIPGKLGKKSTVKVVNKTKSTDFCGLRVGQQREELSVAAGASADFELGTGAYKLCVLACKSAVPARGGNSTNVVGCGDFNLSKPQEIYVFEGKEEPKVEPAAGYQQTKWLNNIDPSYAENAHHPWLTVFGDLKPSYWHVHLDNPCPKAVYVGGKDVKGMGQTRISVDPKRDNDFRRQAARLLLLLARHPRRRQTDVRSARGLLRAEGEGGLQRGGRQGGEVSRGGEQGVEEALTGCALA